MPPRVFISYSHDSQGHMDRVWELSERFRGDGVDCRIDQQPQWLVEGISDRPCFILTRVFTMRAQDVHSA